MIRRLTIWIASMTIGLLMMALALASAAHAQPAAAPHPPGDRHGAISTPMGSLRIGLGFTHDASVAQLPLSLAKGPVSAPYTRASPA